MWPNPQFPAIWSHLLKKSLMTNFISCAVPRDWLWTDLSDHICPTSGHATGRIYAAPISCHWSLSRPPENIRKPEVSDVFKGSKKRSVAWNGLSIL